MRYVTHKFTIVPTIGLIMIEQFVSFRGVSLIFSINHELQSFELNSK